jgi:hypothetical protein
MEDAAKVRELQCKDACEFSDVGYALDARDAWQTVKPGADVRIVNGPCPDVSREFSRPGDYHSEVISEPGGYLVRGASIEGTVWRGPQGWEAERGLARLFLTQEAAEGEIAEQRAANAKSGADDIIGRLEVVPVSQEAHERAVAAVYDRMEREAAEEAERYMVRPYDALMGSLGEMDAYTFEDACELRVAAFRFNAAVDCVIITRTEGPQSGESWTQHRAKA